MTPIEVLLDRYPALVDEIQTAARAGHVPEDIQASINRLTQQMGTQGASPAEVYQTLTGKPLTPEAGPSAPERVVQGLLRGASLGIFGKSYEPDPYASVIQTVLMDLAPEMVGGLLPFGGATKLLGATGLPGVVARAAGITPGAVKAGATTVGQALKLALPSAATEAGAFGAVGAATEGVQQVRKGQFDPLEIVRRAVMDALLGGGIGSLSGIGRALKAGRIAGKQAEIDAAIAEANRATTEAQAAQEAARPLDTLAQGAPTVVPPTPETGGQYPIPEPAPTGPVTGVRPGWSPEAVNLLLGKGMPELPIPGVNPEAVARAGAEPIQGLPAMSGPQVDIGVTPSASRARIMEALSPTVDFPYPDVRPTAPGVPGTTPGPELPPLGGNFGFGQAEGPFAQPGRIGAQPALRKPTRTELRNQKAALMPPAGPSVVPEPLQPLVEKLLSGPQGEPPVVAAATAESVAPTRGTRNLDGSTHIGKQPPLEPSVSPVGEAPVPAAGRLGELAGQLTALAERDLTLPDYLKGLSKEELTQRLSAGRIESPSDIAKVRQHLRELALKEAKVAVDPELLQIIRDEIQSGTPISAVRELIKSGAWPGADEQYLIQALKGLDLPTKPTKAAKAAEAVVSNFGEVTPERQQLTLPMRDSEVPVPAGTLPGMPNGAGPVITPEGAAKAAEVAAATAPTRDARRIASGYVKAKSVPPEAVAPIHDILGAAKPDDVLPVLNRMPDGPSKMYVKQAADKRIRELEGLGMDRQVLQRMPDGRFKVCASPCQPLPEGAQYLDDATRQRYEQRLNEALGIQQPEAIRKRSWMEFFKSPMRWYREGGLYEWRSMSEMARAAGDKPLMDLVDLADEQTRQAARWRGKIAEQANTHLKIFESSEQDYIAGSLMDAPGARMNPKFMASLDPKVKDAVVFAERFFRETATALGMKPEDMLSEYFPHMFSRDSIRSEILKWTEALQGGALPPGVNPTHANLVLNDLQAVLAKMDSRLELRFRDLPQSFKEAFLEHRYGFKGYNLSLVKALNAYTQFAERKIFFEPYLQRITELVQQVQDPELKQAAALYAKDLLGLTERKWSHNTVALSSSIRGLEFARTIGTFNIGSALKNMGQNLFTAVDGGLRNFTKGMGMAIEANRDPAGYLTRTLEETGQLADIPMWHARTGGPVQSGFRKWLEHSGYFFNLVEKGNRRISFYTGLSKWFESTAGRQAGVDLATAVEKEMLPREAIQYANDFVRRNQFRYGRADMPLALRDPVVGTLLQYSSYRIKSAEMLWRWLTQECTGGKAKFASLIAIGAGLTSLGDLAGLDLSRFVGVPVDFLSWVRAGQAAKQDDWKQAGLHVARGLWESAAQTPFGPTASGLSHAYGLAQAATSGDPLDKAALRFVRQDLTPVQIRQAYDAYQNYVGGGSAEELVFKLVGTPNIDTSLRLMYLQLLKDGKSQKAQDLLQLYRLRSGGTVPLSLTARREALLSAAQDKLKRGVEEARMPLADRLRRGLPQSIARLIP